VTRKIRRWRNRRYKEKKKFGDISPTSNKKKPNVTSTKDFFKKFANFFRKT
jgi:hypothetical protein